MPTYVFDCPCGTQIKKNLKMGEHPTHPCPECGAAAPRAWMGNGFGFGFAASPKPAPANTGVAKNDYPTADRIVGSDADTRWELYEARAKVKEQVRAVGGDHALNRRNGDGFVEYAAGGKELIAQRKDAANAIRKGIENGAIVSTSQDDAIKAQIKAAKVRSQ